MDYPKSVPNIGLVNGKFVDENTGTGVVGSLVPSAWGNAVTDEILQVVTDVGLVPDEENHGQLSQAISKKITDSVASQDEAIAGTSNTKTMSPLRVVQVLGQYLVQATETVIGWAKVATQVQVNAGTDDTSFVTPKKLKSGFNFAFGSTSMYMVFPAWLGGWIIQGGIYPVAASTTATFTLGLAFPNAALFSICQSMTLAMSTAHTTGFGCAPIGLNQLRIQNNYSGSSLDFGYLAIGR